MAEKREWIIRLLVVVILATLLVDYFYDKYWYFQKMDARAGYGGFSVSEIIHLFIEYHTTGFGLVLTLTLAVSVALIVLILYLDDWIANRKLTGR